jgi:diaminohydroxyphosphoribosylaminopyrimidine deaminase/5-amino-6-(5-phosphoribosylamino)uracil reductase
VIGCQDPFAKVQGRGIQKLREAGIDLSVGVLEEECKALNKRFMTFHGKQRPFVTLKWAESEDGFIDGHISNTYTQMVCHKRRAEHQAI